MDFAAQFCYTGRMGLMGNLSTAQIVDQVVQAQRFVDGHATPSPPPPSSSSSPQDEEGAILAAPITNIVFM